MQVCLRRFLIMISTRGRQAGDLGWGCAGSSGRTRDCIVGISPLPFLTSSSPPPSGLGHSHCMVERAWKSPPGRSQLYCIYCVVLPTYLGQQEGKEKGGSIQYGVSGGGGPGGQRARADLCEMDGLIRPHVYTCIHIYKGSTIDTLLITYLSSEVAVILRCQQ